MIDRRTRARTHVRPGLVATVTLLALALIAVACTSPTTDADPAAPAAEADADVTSTIAAADDGAGEAQGAEDDGQPSTDAAIPTWDIDAALAADPNCSSPVTGDALKVGYAADLSEIGGPADRPGSQAARHLADLVNCSGGLNGRPIEVIVADISGDAATSRSAILDLLAQDVQVLLGPPFPDFGFRVLQVTAGEIPVLFTGSTEPALADSELLSYLVAFNDTQGATVAADFALLQGWRTAVTFSSPGPYFGYNTVVFEAAFESGGGEVLNDYGFVPLETEDFSEAVAEIAANPPDVIYSPMFANQMVALARQLEAAGVDTELVQSDAFEATGGYSIPGTDGIIHVTHAFPAEGSRVVRLDESIAAANGVGTASATFAGLAGDAMAVVIAAYFASGESDDPVLLGKAIATVQAVEGVTGTISYNGTGLPEKQIYVHQVVDGEPTLVLTAG